MVVRWSQSRTSSLNRPDVNSSFVRRTRPPREYIVRLLCNEHIKLLLFRGIALCSWNVFDWGLDEVFALHRALTGHVGW